jgi:hypothetical protein
LCDVVDGYDIRVAVEDQPPTIAGSASRRHDVGAPDVVSPAPDVGSVSRKLSHLRLPDIEFDVEFRSTVCEPACTVAFFAGDAAEGDRVGEEFDHPPAATLRLRVEARAD